MARLPILMYHNVSNDIKTSKGLTIAAEKLECHFRYLVENNFTTFHLSELENTVSIPDKSVVITFDDVTQNQLIYAVPLLQKYNLKATFFIPFAYIGKTDLWNNRPESLGEKIMAMDELQNLDSRVELGLHSFAHKKYANLSEKEITEDFEKCYKIIEENKLKVYPAVAYPYGNYPKNEPMKSEFIKVLGKNKVKMGLRIGNKVNSFPFKNPYEIMRIDIKGEENLLKFRLKLRFGKLKLF
ncbi:polysaccharide deacetylase family protein [Flavobacterium sp.]|uniref:polysaccharide deacetylase family protein n=1 Tax=Flavobacterium sp. TaxID=239 RepID=UPI0026293809|nr:polysaccharide deacetylase family protein [Flavobacterium sp.]